jgi:hypothetical protein
MRRHDAVAGVVVAGLGIFVTRQGRALSYLDEFGPGPGFLPYWLGLLLMALAACLIISAMRSHTRIPKQEPGVGSGAGRALLAALGLVVMAATLEVLGFIGSFALLSFFLVYVVERRTLAGAITVTAALTLSFFLLFRVVLALPLPMGAWRF